MKSPLLLLLVISSILWSSKASSAPVLYEVTNATLQVFPNEVQSPNATFVFAFILQYELGINVTASATFDFSSYLNQSNLSINASWITCNNLTFTYGAVCVI